MSPIIEPAWRPRLRRLVRGLAAAITGALTWAAALCLLYAGYQFWVTDLLAGWNQQQLRAAAGSTTAPLLPAAPSAAVPTGPSPVVLRIPRIDLDLVVVGGVSRDDLRRGPDILPGTPVPGRAATPSSRGTGTPGAGRSTASTNSAPATRSLRDRRTTLSSTR